MAYCPECAKEYPDDWRVCPQDESALLKSQFIGKYKIEAVLGVGGMGAVYKGINPDTHAPVAIKVLHPSAASEEQSRARFQREAASISALTTRHLVNIYDFGAEDDGTLFLVMEFLHGHSLREEVHNNRRVPMQRINMVMEGALRGLGAAHRKGIIHRDLKPENIFVADTEDGEVVKVLDFGVAQVQTTNPSSVLTQEGALLGTPAYMAPEQVTGSRGEMGPWTDVYAMGVILYEMLTGETPFHADSMTAVLSKVLMREFTPLQAVRGDLPGEVFQLVDRAMADQAHDRFRDALEFREAWMDVYRRLGPGITSATTPRFVPSHVTNVAADPYSGTQAASSVEQLTSNQRSRAVGTAETHASMTPGPVVVDSIQESSGGRTGLWVALGLLVVGGVVGAVILTQGGSKKSAKAPDPPPAAAVDAAVPTRPNPNLASDAAPAPALPEGMARIAGGEFEMGVDLADYKGFKHAQGKHRMRVASFAIDKTEMTVAAFKAALANMKAPPPLRGDQPDEQLPVRNVSWQEASAVCASLGKRLPTEAEWEYAATRHRLDPKGARLRTSADRGPARVGTHPGDCSPQGVCDLLGNLLEWTADAAIDASGKPDPKLRMLRGGSYSVSPKSKFYASPYARIPTNAGVTDGEIGFRCSKTVE